MAVVTLRTSGNSGFTLIEILVVLAVLSVCIGLITLPSNSGRFIYLQAETLQQVMQGAAEEAIFGNTETGVALTPHGYCVVKYDPESMRWKQQEHCHDVPQGMKLSLMQNGREILLPGAYSSQSPQPAILFFASGETTAFTLAVSGASPAQSVEISANGMGSIKLQDGKAAP